MPIERKAIWTRIKLINRMRGKSEYRSKQGKSCLTGKKKLPIEAFGGLPD
jgi:hypothetical protein